MSFPTSDFKEVLPAKPNYEGSFEDTKSIFESFDEQIKSMKDMFIKRIVHLENENSSLVKEIKKCTDEKGYLERVILSLKLENKQLENKDKEIDLKVQNNRLKMKLTSVVTLHKDDILLNSTGKLAASDVVISNDEKNLNDEKP